MCILGIGPIITIQAETGFIGSIAITLSTIENSRVLLHKTDKMVFMKNRTKEIYRYGNPWQADEWANYLPESLGMKPSHSLSKIIWIGIITKVVPKQSDDLQVLFHNLLHHDKNTGERNKNKYNLVGRVHHVKWRRARAGRWNVRLSQRLRLHLDKNRNKRHASRQHPAITVLLKEEVAVNALILYRFFWELRE